MQGKTFALNLGAPFIYEKYPKEMIELIKYADIIFGNESVRIIFSVLMSPLCAIYAQIEK